MCTIAMESISRQSLRNRWSLKASHQLVAFIVSSYVGGADPAPAVAAAAAPGRVSLAATLNVSEYGGGLTMFSVSCAVSGMVAASYKHGGAKLSLSVAY